MLHCCHIVLGQEMLDQNRSVRWSIIVQVEPTVGSEFWGAFRSDCIAKPTKDVTVHFFIHSSNFLQIIPANSENISWLLRKLFPLAWILTPDFAARILVTVLTTLPRK